MTSTTLNTAGYTLEVLTSKTLTVEIIDYIAKVAKDLGARWRVNGGKFPLIQYLNENRMVLCWRREELVGMCMARLTYSPFDPEVIILRQDVLYGKQGTRAAKLLLDDFIDFGRRNANHVITNINKETRIKPRSLEKLGFKELEVLYRLETRNGK